jgi:SAM-dependent methyltransferase
VSDTRAFYDELADDYDALFADWDAAVRRQGALIDALIGDLPGPVLDVAAGMGTQAIGLALRGREVIGRDLSPRLVERARHEAARLGARISFEVGDMRELRETDRDRHAAVIAFDNALPHLMTDDDLRCALRGARSALRPGGRFLASIRDYDALACGPPACDAPRVFGSAPNRRAIFQIWDWAADGRSYVFDHFVLRETATGWSSRARRGCYRALLRADLEAAASAEGLVDLRWIAAETTGFYQPIFVAYRPTGA